MTEDLRSSSSSVGSGRSVVPLQWLRTGLSRFRNPAAPDRALLPLSLVALFLALVGGVMIDEPADALTIATLGVGVLTLIAGALRLPPVVSDRTIVLVTIGATSAIVMFTVVRFGQFWTSSSAVIAAQILGVLLVGVAAILDPDLRRLGVVLAVTGVAVVGLASAQVAYQEPLAIDVYELHEAAADSLASGRNPYTTGNVQVMESHPFPGRELIEESPSHTHWSYGAWAVHGGCRRVVHTCRWRWWVSWWPIR